MKKEEPDTTVKIPRRPEGRRFFCLKDKKNSPGGQPGEKGGYREPVISRFMGKHQLLWVAV